MNKKIIVLIFLFGGVFLVRISREWKVSKWTIFHDQFAKLSNLQHAKIIMNKAEVHCKAEFWDSPMTYVNTKTGFSVNMTIDINQELPNIAVIFETFDQRTDPFW